MRQMKPCQTAQRPISICGRASNWQRLSTTCPRALPFCKLPGALIHPLITTSAVRQDAWRVSNLTHDFGKPGDLVGERGDLGEPGGDRMPAGCACKA